MFITIGRDSNEQYGCIEGDRYELDTSGLETRTVSISRKLFEELVRSNARTVNNILKKLYER